MKNRTLITTIVIASVALLAASCGGAKSGNEKAIKSTTAGDTTVTLAGSTGELKNGENELVLSFTDATGKPVDIPAASLKFHMPAMGAMAEMNDAATLTTTETPGRFRAQVNIESSGSWDAMISFQGPRGTQQAMMSVGAK